MPRLRTPWYYGWNIVAIGITFQAILFGTTMFAFTMWVEPWKAAFGIDRGEVMYGFLALGLVQSMISPFAGRAMDRLSIRALICGGAGAAAIGFLIISQATAFWQIATVYGSLIMIGVLLAGPLAAQTLAVKWFRGRRGLAIGLATIGTSLGGMIFVPAVTWLELQYGWRDAHVIIACVVAGVILPMVWTFVRNTPGELGIEPEPEARQDAASGPAPTFPQWTTKKIVTNRNFWVMVLAFTPMVTAFGAMQQNLAPFAADHGIGQQSASWMVSAMSGSMICGKIFFGYMGDRWDHRYLYWIAVGVLSSALVGMLFELNYGNALILSGLLGFSAGAFLPLLGAIVGSRFGPTDFGRVLGLLGPFLAISNFGPLIAGRVRDDLGSYDPVIQAFLIAMVPALLAMIFLRSLKQPAKAASSPVPAAGE